MFEFRDASGATLQVPGCYTSQRLRRTQAIAVDEFRYVRSLTDRTPKVTMPSPSALHFFRLNAFADAEVYPNADQFWSDLVQIYREELAALSEAGCHYVQFDEVPLALLCDASIRAKVQDLGEDPEALVDRYITAMSAVLRDRPAEMTVAMHLCRGNHRSHWIGSGGYEPVAEQLFNRVEVDAFMLEYDSPRAGDFTPLSALPSGTRATLGLVSTKSAALETVDALKRRIDEAANFHPLENFGISPQCGFASTAHGNALSEEDEIAKLNLVVEVAREVWGNA